MFLQLFFIVQFVVKNLSSERTFFVRVYVQSTVLLKKAMIFSKEALICLTHLKLGCVLPTIIYFYPSQNKRRIDCTLHPLQEALFA